MRKGWITATIVAAVIGIAVSSVSIYEYVGIQKKGLEEASFCSISEVVNCDAVNASSYSELFGVPVAAWGLLFYLLTIVYALRSLFSKKTSEPSLDFIWGVNILGFIWTLRMAYVTAFILHAVCITCFAQYIINLFMLIALTVASTVSLKDRVVKIFSKRFVPNVALSGLIFIAGGLLTGVLLASPQGKPSAKDIKEVVSAHFVQSLNDIDQEDIADAPTWGNPDAKVAIIEFSDFQCPFCRVAAFNIKPYLYEFRDDVKFSFINYPLDKSCNKYVEAEMHKNACTAAKAVTCANEKGKFWEYHDDVFRNQNKISRDMLVGLAAKNGIDKDWMESCIDSPETLAKVEKDIETAHHVYIMGTPSVMINNRPLRYWRSPDVLRAVIKEEIKRSGK